MNKQKNEGVWAGFFSQGFSAEGYDAFRENAHSQTSNFLQDIKNGNIHVDDDHASPRSDNPVLDQWVANNDLILAQLVRDIQSHILAVTEFALPAHDERQILFKDASEGLRFSSMEQPEGYKATFVIPMFTHDIGRLLEGCFYDPQNNPHDNWIPHAQFSFLLLKEILDKPEYVDIPTDLKNHFLYAVLAHSGDNGGSYMSRAVQACDRMQLIGAEGFFRAMSYGTCLMDAQIQYPDNEDYQTRLPTLFEHRSVLSILEYCSRNMRQNIGEKHADWQRRIDVENVALLMIATYNSPEVMERMFAPELQQGCQFECSKREINIAIFNDARDLFYKYMDKVSTGYSPADISTSLFQSLESPMGAVRLTYDMKRSLNRAVTVMSDEERKALGQVIGMADLRRAEQDDIDRNVCLEMSRDPRRYVAAIAEVALTYTSEPVMKLEAAPARTHALNFGQLAFGNS